MTKRTPIRWRDLRWSTRCVLLGVLLLGTLIVLEMASRLYWRVAHQVPLFATGKVWQAEYPEWDASGIDRLPEDPAEYRVLLLGGSTLFENGAELQTALTAHLAPVVGKPVRVVNLAFYGRTTRDNVFKYERLAGRHFDLILTYDGINDHSANNCPDSVYRADYAHIPHLANLRSYLAHPEVGWWSTPYTAARLTLTLGFRWHLLSQPRGHWARHGADLRSPAAYEANVASLQRLARERGQRVALATFAYHLPDDYSGERFAAGALDYATPPRNPVSMWGEPAHVRNAIDAHNAITRRLAGEGVIEMATTMPHGARYWSDICHLTSEGRAAFAELLAASLSRR